MAKATDWAPSASVTVSLGREGGREGKGREVVEEGGGKGGGKRGGRGKRGGGRKRGVGRGRGRRGEVVDDGRRGRREEGEG